MLATRRLGNGSLLSPFLVGVAALAWTAVAEAQTTSTPTSSAGSFGGGNPFGGTSGFTGGGSTSGFTGSSFSGSGNTFGGGFSGTGSMSGTGFTGGTGNSSNRGGFNGNWVGNLTGGGNRGSFTGGGYGTGAAGTGTGTGTASAFSLYNVNPVAPGTPNLSRVPDFNSPIYGNGTGGLQGGFSGFQGTSSYGFQGTSNSPLGANSSPGNTGYGTAAGARRMPYYSASTIFDYRPAGPNLIQGEVERVLTRSTSLSPNRVIRVAVEGPAVVLRGTVASDQDRRLAEGLIRLTPGVYEVRNELEVAGSTLQPGPGP